MNAEIGLESVKLQCEIDKLKAETKNLESSNQWENRISRYIPLFTIVIAIGSFSWGIYQFRQQQQTQIDILKTDFNNKTALSEREFDNRIRLAEKEFRNKFYEKQLDTYFNITKITTQISTETEKEKVEKLYKEFSDVYYGNLMIVQDDDVEKASDEFMRIYKNQVYNKNNEKHKELRDSARNLANSCKKSLARVWNINYLNEK